MTDEQIAKQLLKQYKKDDTRMVFESMGRRI